ncbi:MAG: hypothetical protein MI924_03465, partial [Chloroflexales bacterium]|nr:hypothetical protein [Chloroflexales bacterium]
WSLALRRGRLATAEVVTLSTAPPGSRVTFDAATNGCAKGYWVVYLPQRTSTADFMVGEPWVATLRLGARVRVLLHPTRPKILVSLGP